MNWEYSEAGLCWYLNRPNGQSVCRLAIREKQKIAVLFILDETTTHGSARFSTEGMTENNVLNVASGLYRDHLTTVLHEMLTVEVKAKE